MKTLTINGYGKTYEIKLELSTYTSNQNTALLATCTTGEPYGSFTVNIEPMPDASIVALDTNNSPNILVDLQDAHLCEQIGTIRSGFCVYPIVKLNKETLKEYLSKEDIAFMENHFSKE